MIAEFKAFFTLFQQGKELTHAATWKNKQIAGNALVGVLAAAALISRAFGYDLHLDEATIKEAGVGVVALFGIGNSILTTITSSKVGVKKK